MTRKQEREREREITTITSTLKLGTTSRSDSDSDSEIRYVGMEREGIYSSYSSPTMRASAKRDIIVQERKSGTTFEKQQQE